MIARHVAPRFGFDAIQEARFRLGAQDTGFAYHVVKPGQRGGAHRHQAAEEIDVVIASSGQTNPRRQVAELRTLVAARVAPEVARAFEAGPDGLELLAFGLHHEGDGEMLPENLWER